MTATLTAPPDPRAARVAEPPLPPGTAVGRYVVREPLGEGGMSRVYRADDPALRRQVALKVLRADLSTHVTGRERFAREGQAMALLAHPHVATIHDVGQHDGRVFLALELREGGTLSAWMARPRSWREVDRMLTATARGLAAAHAAGIVHRDFKPDNVLLTAGGVPRVSDFGLAGSLDGALPVVAGASPALTVAGAVVGTPAYMAPEQKDGRPADERSDQYSLCLVWLEALGRDRRAPADDAGQARGPRRRIRVLLRGLATDPAARWPDVAALLDALDRQRTGRRVVVLGAGATLAAVAAVAVGLARRGSSVEPSPPLRVVKRWSQQPTERWRMLLAADGHTVARASSDRDGLSLVDDDTGRRTPLPLPPGRISTRGEAVAAMSSDGRVVLIRMDDGSVWRTGPALAAPVLMRARGNGPVCLHPSGDRVAVSALERDPPTELRSTDDGRLLATAPHGDLCAWAGDRLVLGFRDGGDLPVRLEVVEADGTTRRLPPLPGELSTMTADGDELIVAHAVKTEGGLVSTLSRLALDDLRPPVPFLVERDVALGPVVVTARGLFVGRNASFTGLHAATLDGGPVALRSIETGNGNDRPGAWLAPGVLAYDDGARLVTQRWPGGASEPHAVSAGPLVGLAGDQPAVLEDDGDRVILRAVSPRGARVVRAEPRATFYLLRCDGDAGCALGRLDGDQVRFARLDPTTGEVGPSPLARPLSGTPHAQVARDGRWLVESAGALTIVDGATGATTALATPGLLVNDASWGHDLTYVIATGQDRDGPVLARVELTGAVTTLTRATSDLLAPRLAPDGRAVAVLLSQRLFEYVLLAR